MKDYKNLEKVFAKINDLKKSLELISWDAEITKNWMKAKIDQIVTLKSIIYEISTSKEVESLINGVQVEMLDDWQKANFCLMKAFCNKVKEVSFELSTDFIKKSILCRCDFALAKKENDFKILLPAFTELVDVARKIASTQIKGKQTKYEALLESYQVSPAEIDEICVSVSPFLKSKIKHLSHQEENDKTTKINVSRIIDRFLPSDVLSITIGDSPHFFGGCQPFRIIAKDKGEDAMPSLFHIIGKALYMQNLPHLNYESQPICSPTSLAMYSGQGFLFSHFLLEEKNIAEMFGYRGKKSFDYSIMGANKFVALTHLMIRFSLERSLINGEIETSNLESLFKEDIRYYFKVEDSSINILENKHWFFGKFCRYPCYLKGMIVAGQLFHMIKSEQAIWNCAKPNLKKLTTWLAKEVYSNGARYSGGDLIEKLTGEKLDCRFFKKFE